MRVTLKNASAIYDVELVGVDPDMALKQMMMAGGWVDPPARVMVDGRRHRTDEPLSSVYLLEGSVVSEIEEQESGARVELVRLAGLSTGQHLPLSPGTYDVGSSASETPGIGHAQEPHFRLQVHPDGNVTATPLVAGVVVEGELAAPGQPVLVTTPDAVYRVDAVDGSHNRSGPSQPQRSATRRPRLLSSPAHAVLDVPPPPPEPRGSISISWLVALAPVPIGVVLAFLISPFFLAFAAMSPIISIARWRDGKKRVRIDRADTIRHNLVSLHRFGAQIRQQADVEAQYRRDQYVDLRRQERIALSGSPRLWEVRPYHPDYLQVTVGLGEAVWTPTVRWQQSVEGVDEALDANSFLRSAPATVSLCDVRGIGVVGPPDVVRRVASALVLELAVCQGPADVQLHCLLDADSARRWDWLKWLPHLYSSSGEARLMLDVGSTSSIQELPTPDIHRGQDAGREPVPVILIDSQDHLRTGLPLVAGVVNRQAAVGVVVADHVDDLPAFCGAVLQLSADGLCRLSMVNSGEVQNDVLAPVADMTVISNAARAMSRYVDPEVSGSAAQVPARCKLGELSSGDIEHNALAERWRRSSQKRGTSLAAVLGAGAEGTMAIDLVKDGPHALVAGTTGSGKSELLRTLVASMAWKYGPDQVTFVLVDFKGGGAFDACSDLPHTVGVVTDLDSALASRALRCMRAELKYRELRLREAGVSDLAELPESTDPLPRLVIVVDEFATLAAELPEFMESLIDVAQRGRSLGIHMVLATQRPAGVVDNKIRANTNLRIALRVQDDSDSIEVIGCTDAANIHRAQQGRAFARLGASELVPFQTALVSEPPELSGGTALRLKPFRLLLEEADDQTGTASSIATGPTELEMISKAAKDAALTLELGSPRVPWPEPMPSAGELSDFELSDLQPWEVAVGEVDLPDEQRRSTFLWSGPDDGNVLVYGVDSADAASVLGTYCTAIAAAHSVAQAHLYVVDFAGALSALSDLPHVGGYLGPEDNERIVRLLDLLETCLDDRRRMLRDNKAARLGPSNVPLLGLFIANYSGLIEHFDEQGDLEGAVRLAAVLRDGPPLGVFTFASGAGERGIPMKVAAQAATKFVLRLADRTAYAAFGLRSNEIPPLGPGRAIDARSGFEVQFAKPAWNLNSDHSVEVPEESAGPVRLRTLETDIPLSLIGTQSNVTQDLWRLAIGVKHEDLSEAHLEIRAGVHTAIAGPPASGRTTTLRSIATALELASPSTPVAGIGIDIGQAISSESDLTNFANGGGLLLVDDIERLPTELSACLEQLVMKPPQELRIVVAGRNETLKGMQPIMRLLTAGRTGVLLRPGADAGDVFKCRLRTKGVHGPGRGFLLNGGLGGLVQIAHGENFADLARDVAIGGRN